MKLWKNTCIIGRIARGNDLVLPRARHNDAPKAWRTALTDREREIASLAAQGLQEIAKRLGLTDGRIRFQVHNILRKLGLKKPADLA